jgi:hypothetical protein
VTFVRPEWVEGKTSGTIGAIGELRVSVDLMAKGFNGQIYRVEARTGSRNANGALHYSNPYPSRHDIMAVVEHSGNITYLPELP